MRIPVMGTSARFNVGNDMWASMETGKETVGVKTLLGDPTVAIPTMVAPLAVAILIQNVNCMTDLMWVSWLGSNAIGGLSLAYPLYSTICGFGNGLGIGVSSAIARHVGVRDREGAIHTAGQAIFLSVLFAIILACIFVPLARPLMNLFGGGEAVEASLEYGMPIFSFGFFIIISSGMSGVLRGEGAARASMIIQVAGAITNIILDPIFIYVLGMGVAGAGWATVLAGLVSLLLGLSFYMKKDLMYVRFRPKDMIPNFESSKEILYVGLPQSAEYTVMAMINLPMNFIIVGVGGAAAVGIYTSAWRVAFIAFVPAQAYGGAIVSVCSAEYSAKRSNMIEKAFGFAVKKSIRHSIYLAIALVVLAYPLATVFTIADDLTYMRADMVYLFLCIAAMLPIMSQVFVGSSFLQSVRHSGVALMSSLLRNIVMVAGYALMAWMFHTTLSIWVIMAVIEILGGVLMSALAWKYIKQFSEKCSKDPTANLPTS